MPQRERHKFIKYLANEGHVIGEQEVVLNHSSDELLPHGSAEFLDET